MCTRYTMPFMKLNIANIQHILWIGGGYFWPVFYVICCIFVWFFFGRSYWLAARNSISSYHYSPIIKPTHKYLTIYCTQKINKKKTLIKKRVFHFWHCNLIWILQVLRCAYQFKAIQIFGSTEKFGFSRQLQKQQQQ